MACLGTMDRVPNTYMPSILETKVSVFPVFSFSFLKNRQTKVVMDLFIFSLPYRGYNTVVFF